MAVRIRPVQQIRPSRPDIGPVDTCKWQASYPQVVLFGDSLFEASVEAQDGFSFFAALQKRELSPRLLVIPGEK